jgi:hypothetical protein
MLKRFFDGLLKYWVLIPVAYFGFGLLTMLLFYSPYGINVLKYIDLSEIFTVWFLYSTTALIYFLAVIFMFWFLKLVGTSSRGDYHYFHLLFNLLPILIWIFLILRYFVNIFNIAPDSLFILRHSVNFILPFMICTLCLISLTRSTYSTVKNIFKELYKKEKTTHVELNAYLGFFLVALFSFTIPVSEFQAISYHNVADITKVYTKTDTISSDNDLVVVGQTKSFIIFFRKSTHSPKIISLKEVTKIDIEPLSNNNKVQLKNK